MFACVSEGDSVRRRLLRRGRRERRGHGDVSQLTLDLVGVEPRPSGAPVLRGELEDEGGRPATRCFAWRGSTSLGIEPAPDHALPLRSPAAGATSNHVTRRSWDESHAPSAGRYTLWHTTQVTRALFSLLIALAGSLFGSCSPPPENTGEACPYCCHAENQASWETCYGRGSALCPSMPFPGSAGPSAACNAICVPEACRCVAANQCAPPRCDPTSCSGCCDESQVCQAGTIDTECGSGGRNCGPCSAGESCGRIVSGECD